MTSSPEGRLRDPSKLFYQQDTTRRYIISAYWCIIILALPLWWSTTSIKRLSLPSGRVTSQGRSHLRIPITLNIETEHSGHLLTARLRESIDGLISRTQDRWKGLDTYLYQGQSNGTLPLKAEGCTA
jgi:phosphatidylinositol glycan class S